MLHSGCRRREWGVGIGHVGFGSGVDGKELIVWMGLLRLGHEKPDKRIRSWESNTQLKGNKGSAQLLKDWRSQGRI